MSRADRRRAARTTERTARHINKRHGCTCSPTLQTYPTGFLVDHQLGCVLGDKVKRLNDLGILPGWPMPSRRSTNHRRSA